jgi:Ca-activated chloride channel family protein
LLGSRRSFGGRATRSLLAVLAALLLSSGALSTAAAESPAPAATASDVILVLDASGSMWGLIEGENKIVIARRVMDGLIDGLADGRPVGLIAYGHRREADCEDIEVVRSLAPLSDKAAMKATVNALSPKGKTPITRSVERAFELLQGRPGPATVLVVTDGLETCGGDPCGAVRAAKAAGGEFAVHVVGFDVAREDVSQLECMAQAGDGLFLTAENAAELGQAMETVTALPAEVPAGRLIVKAVADGKLHDVAITVTGKAGEKVAASRTYASPDTNPRSVPLADGRYAVSVFAMGIKGGIQRNFEIEIADGSTVEREFDFSSGELSIGVTRNGAPSDAVYHVQVAGTSLSDLAAQGRTYTAAGSNPAVVRLTAGRYRVTVGSVEIFGQPEHDFGVVEVEPRGRVDITHAFESGDLLVGALRRGELVDALVHIYGSDGKQVAQARTYKAPNTNPKRFVLVPGDYRVEISEIRGKKKTVAVTIAAGETSEQMAEME